MFRARLHCLQFLTEPQAEILTGALGDIALSASAREHQSGQWIFEWLFEMQPDPAVLESLLFAAQPELTHLDWQIEKLDPAWQEKDWLAESYRSFQAFCVGPFYIYGAHETPQAAGDQIPLQIDAATAFGSGAHPTTAGCLRAMADLKDQGFCPWNVLDMGTGSGILAIAAYKLWKTSVLGIDNDPECIIVSERHQSANKIPVGAHGLSLQTGDGFSSPLVTQKKPFDLVIANILAGPLVAMAPALVSVCDSNGYVILSGIIADRAREVISAYTDQGLVLVSTAEETLDGHCWTTLVLRRMQQS
ncbi:MAG: 50S ribosomal protein L11 methyltransferase [Alphaproteobacteria bacterium]|nr:50S ribosomal protein L11 methyltransferase [Alphaproteobacteria bacterium]